jgi:hypothetical protein
LLRQLSLFYHWMCAELYWAWIVRRRFQPGQAITSG